MNLIDLNGADNITINGLNTGDNTLSISNTTSSNVIGTSAIRFIADATSNTVTNTMNMFFMGSLKLHPILIRRNRGPASTQPPKFEIALDKLTN